MGKQFWRLKGGSRNGVDYNAKKFALDRTFYGGVWENLAQPPSKKVSTTKRNWGDAGGTLTESQSYGFQEDMEKRDYRCQVQCFCTVEEYSDWFIQIA